jgi:hypothetical protein
VLTFTHQKATAVLRRVAQGSTSILGRAAGWFVVFVHEVAVLVEPESIGGAGCGMPRRWAGQVLHARHLTPGPDQLSRPTVMRANKRQRSRLTATTRYKGNKGTCAAHVGGEQRRRTARSPEER